MILTCPACGTRYQVDPATIGPQGRTVRCSKCGHSWMQMPAADAPPAAVPAPAASAEANAAPAPETGAERARIGAIAPGDRPATRRGPVPPRRERMSGLARALWVLLLLVVGGTTAGAFVWRDAIVETWPAAAPLYALVGLGDPPGDEQAAVDADCTRLCLSNVKSVSELRGNVRVVAVRGDIVNQSDTAFPVPMLVGVLYDKENQELRRWSFAPPQARLSGGERMTFRSEVRDPPATASELKIYFATNAPQEGAR